MNWRGAKFLGVWIGLLLAAGVELRAMDYAVPYARDGLGYSIDTWGYGSTLGLLEVTISNNYNGIQFYGNAPERGLQTFKSVLNFSGYELLTNDSAHGTLVAHIMDNMFSYNSQTNVPYTSLDPYADWYITTWSLGMAPRANYYGALFDGGDSKTSFLSLNTSLASLILTNHVQAINNSWGGSYPSASFLNGNSDMSLLMDEYAGFHGKTGGTTARYNDVLLIMAAGNETSLVNAPADAYNVLSVGALDSGNPTSNVIDDPTRSPIPRLAPFSSRLPLADGRCGVHVVAPGTQLAVIDNFTVGKVGTNLVLQDLSGYLGSGTSFAAPLVTGLAGILYGAPNHPVDNSETWINLSLKTLKGSDFITDHKLIKALIINGADRIAGTDSNGVAQSVWQPGEISVGLDGVTNSIHPLNYGVGSGQISAFESYYTYYEVSNRFWDVSTLAGNNQTNFYTYGSGKFTTTADPSWPRLQLTATLVWDRHVDYTVNTDASETNTFGLVDTNLLSNLDLILQEETSPGVWADLYRSISTVDNVEYIFMDELPAFGHYRLDVVGNDLADPLAGEQYALAVSYLPIPEPSTVALTGLFGLVVFARRRWLRGRTAAPAAASHANTRRRAPARHTEAW